MPQRRQKEKLYNPYCPKIGNELALAKNDFLTIFDGLGYNSKS